MQEQRGVRMAQEDSFAKTMIEILQDKKNLRLVGGEHLNPLYEAIIAANKKIYKDAEIINLVKDEESLRAALGTDVFLEQISNERDRNRLKALILSGEPLKEVLQMAAIYLAGNKRAQDGIVLTSFASIPKGSRKYILRRLKQVSYADIYVRETEVPHLIKFAERARARRYLRNIFLSGLIIFFIYLARSPHQEKIEDAGQKIRLENSVANLEEAIQQKAEVLRGLEKKKDDLDKQIKQAEGDLTTINTKIAKENDDLEESSKEGELFRPYLSDAYLNLASNYLAKEDYDKAIEANKKAVELNPKNATAYNNLGVAYYSKAQYKEAAELQEKALSLNPQDKIIVYNLGVAYRALGEKGKAVEYFARYLETKPDKEEAKKIKNWIKELTVQ
jgi:tetratricopeptide (TPR) repeat protein